MQLETADDAAEAATRAAALLARAIADAIDRHGRALVAFSGGSTPWMMLRRLAQASLDWRRVLVYQVDERWAPDGDPRRNLTHLRACLPGQAVLHPIPVGDSASPEEAAARYAEELLREAGAAPRLDVVHLGLGPDGHTASLVPGDPALEIVDRDVTATGIYQGQRRVTLTLPMLNRSHRVLWLACGASKQGALRALLQGDRSIPAARVQAGHQVAVADRAALLAGSAAQR